VNISIELPSDLENELSTEASHLKLPLAEYILRVLAFRPFLQNSPKTGVELVAYWESIGVVGSRPDIADSQEHARKLRDQAENRERG
jgi:predicted mannosyl-3-phosphoglycerate phosphatase (HAD superfamily)